MKSLSPSAYTKFGKGKLMNKVWEKAKVTNSISKEQKIKNWGKEEEVDMVEEAVTGILR